MVNFNDLYISFTHRDTHTHTLSLNKAHILKMIDSMQLKATIGVIWRVYWNGRYVTGWRGYREE